MFRHPALHIVTLALVAAAWSAPARATGAWTTYIRMQTCNDVLALRDTVWLSSGEAGLVRWLRSEGRFESVTREPGGLASNSLTALAFDRSGRLWVGTAGKGASRLAADGVSWDLVNAFDGLPSDTVTTLRADGDTVWIGTTRGIALWNGTLVAGSVPDIGTPSPFRSNVVSGIVVLGDTLMVATTDGVYLARLSQNLATWTSGDSGLAVHAVDRLATDGAHAFALAGDGAYLWNRGGVAWTSIGTGDLQKNLRDGFGRVVLATRDSVCRWTGSGWAGIAGGPLADTSPGGGIALAPDPDGLVFASRDGFLYEQGAPWVQRTPPGPVGNDVNNIGAIGGDVWAVTFTHGVSRFDGGTWTNWAPGCCGPGQDLSFINPIYSFTLQFDRTGHVWTSHWETAIERTDLRANPLHFDHPYQAWNVLKADTTARHTDGWSSAVDSMGYVYIGGDTPDLGTYEPMGIDVYDTTGTWLINWKTTNAGLRSNQVRAIAIDRVNNLVWAGFAGHGVGYAPLDSLDGDGNLANGNDHTRLPHFGYINSLLTKNVFGLVAHGDSIWVLFDDNELHRLRGSTLTDQATLNASAQPAPLGAVHPLDVAPNGTVWTASVEGVRAFAPGGGHVDFNTENSPLADNEVRSLSVDPRTGVVWFATASGINRYDPGYRPPPPPSIPSLHLTVYPNPVRMDAMGIALQLKGNGTGYEGEILDITGRVVKRFDSATNGTVIWDGRDRDGNRVRSGVYFVRARGNGHEATARVVVLR